MSRCRVPPPVICACTSPPRRMHRGLSCHATRIEDWAARPSPTTWPTDPVRTRRRARGPFLPPTRRNHARCRCSRVIRARAKSRLRVRAHVGQDGVCCVGSSSKAVLAKQQARPLPQAASKTIGPPPLPRHHASAARCRLSPSSQHLQKRRGGVGEWPYFDFLKKLC